MEFSEIIKKVSSDKRLKPDLMKAENGNNFRAISESAILDVISPILEEAGWLYTIEIKKSDLQIKEAFGPKGRKLQFIATIELRVIFRECNMPMEQGYSLITPIEKYYQPIKHGCVVIESVGMGIDDNDKAMGKAYTYALKYALLKLFRLRYGDDPDYKASEPLWTENKINPKKEDIPEKTEKKSQNQQKSTKKSSKNSEQAMTEGQRDYILGLMKQKGISEQQILGKFSVEPSRDEFIPMKVARAIIGWLQEEEDLPF